MKQFLVLVSGAIVAGGIAAGAAWAQAVPGQVAPDFTLQDTNGEPTALSSQRGKYVVLEWSNHECPFVKKHYGSGNMQGLQAKYTGKGVTWLTVLSSAPEKQGYVTAEQANAIRTERGDHQTAMLLDSDGAVGKLYGAKTTPHMFVIDPEGVVIYAGGIDSTPTPDPDDIATSTNYVAQALDAAMAGQPVGVPEAKPYGCSVKY